MGADSVGFPRVSTTSFDKTQATPKVINVEQAEPENAWTGAETQGAAAVTEGLPAPSATMSEFFGAWGLQPKLDGRRIAQEAGLTGIAGTVDARGLSLAKTFFALGKPSNDGSTLPIVLEGAAHVEALHAEAARAGFRTFVTGALSQPGDRFAKSTHPMLKPTPVVANAGFSYDAPELSGDAPAMLVISDYHFASYPALMPSAEDLKKRGITRVVAGLENEDAGPRSIEEYERIGQPAQSMLALRLRSYVEAGITVDLIGLDAPRAVAADGTRPMQANLTRRLFWEQGAQVPTPYENPVVAHAALDQLEAKFLSWGPGFEGQLARIQRARAELPPK